MKKISFSEWLVDFLLLTIAGTSLLENWHVYEYLKSGRSWNPVTCNITFVYSWHGPLSGAYVFIFPVIFKLDPESGIWIGIVEEANWKLKGRGWSNNDEFSKKSLERDKSTANWFIVCELKSPDNKPEPSS